MLGEEVHLQKDPRKGFCAGKTRQVSLNMFLDHHFKPQFSQLQNGAALPALWLVESIITKVRAEALSWVYGHATLNKSDPV